MSLPATDAERRVGAVLADLGLQDRFLSFGAGETRTSEQAATALGCALGQVVKSLAVMAGGDVVLALVAGDRRLDTKAVAAAVGAKRAWFASPDEVLAATGYEVGGVSPFDLPDGLTVLVDDPLSRFPEVYPAGGSAEAMVRLTSDELLRVSHGTLAHISRAP